MKAPHGEMLGAQVDKEEKSPLNKEGLSSSLRSEFCSQPWFYHCLRYLSRLFDVSEPVLSSIKWEKLFLPYFCYWVGVMGGQQMLAEEKGQDPSSPLWSA